MIYISRITCFVIVVTITMFNQSCYTQGATEVTFQLPDATWYDFYTGESLLGPASGLRRTVERDSRVNLFMKGGTIIPLQKPENNTSYR